MFGLFTRIRRFRLRERPLPPDWVGVLDSNVPFFQCLGEPLRAEFLELLKVFIWEKHWIGAGGLVVTDEIRVTVAAAAVRLVLHIGLGPYDQLSEIVVYPYAYRHKDTDGAVLGEAHTWGTVVLSWPDVRQGLANPQDGHDTATHEFAHVLDIAAGSFNGTPDLQSREDYRPWARVLERHFRRLQGAKRPERQVLRRYGATNEAEFFAVATEAFFEKPRQMKAHLPELFDVLHELYKLDPCDGKDGAPTGRRLRE
ncbi:MAG: zinc-dependent peptidase [Myxococcales bacterium]|nr:zinc-dependent peptidase [Myxococcales bacterium]